MNAETGSVSAEEAIRNLVEKWVVWRDSGEWDRFATVWHDDGVMMATWFQGTAAAFIQTNREAWKRGVRILHFLGGTVVDVESSRAVAQTKGDMPGLTGPEVEELYRDGASWLAGGSIDHRLVLRATTPRS